MAEVFIVNGGLIGCGWAAAIAGGGHDVVVCAPDPSVVARLDDVRQPAQPAMAALETFYGNANAPRHQVARIEVQNSKLMQEALPQNLTLKPRVLAEFEPHFEQDTPIAATSSGSAPETMATGLVCLKRPSIAYPCNPAYLLPTVELVSHTSTLAAALDAVEACYVGIGTTVLRMAKPMRGHLVNRRQFALRREVVHLVETGFASIGNAMKAVPEGLAPRRRLMGSDGNFQLAGGTKAMAGYLATLGDTTPRMGADLGMPDLKAASAMLTSRIHEVDPRPVRRVTRDRALPALIQMLKLIKADYHQNWRKNMNRLQKLALGLSMIAVPLSASAEEYRLGLITPPPHQWTVSATEAAAEIKEKTEGRVDILIFPSGQLGNESQMLQQLQTGAMDFAFFTLGEFANRDPNYGIFLAPYLVDDEVGARELLKGPTAQKLLDDMSNFGLIGFGWGMAGMRIIVTGDKVESVKDLKSKKIRTIPFAPELAFWEALGAAPTPMPLPALYDAFANGQIDGMQIDVEGAWNSKYHEHAQSIIISNHMMFPMAAIGSGRKWEGIEEGDRAVIDSVFARKLDELVASYGEIDAKHKADLETTDVAVTTVGREWFGPAIEAWYAEWREKAPLLIDLEAEAAK